MKYLFTFLCLLFSFILNAQYDFGDAPDPSYPTLMATNGAQHMLSGLWLGANVDAEIDGSAVPFANGDDGNNIDDEDGVTFNTWLVAGQSATINVVASVPAFLDAWIDFDANGNWSDPGDQIFNSQFLNGGGNSLTFSVPVSAANGNFSYARFRFSSSGGLATTGTAIDGEVEDYYIYLGQPSIGGSIVDPDPGLEFVQNEISMCFDAQSGNFVLAYNDDPYPNGPGIGVSFSSDTGQSWTALQLPLPVSGISSMTLVDAYDPAIAADDSGNVYVAQISTDYNWGSGPVNGIYVHKSSDGGQTWNVPVAVNESNAPSGSPDSTYRFNDRCQLIVDLNPSSAYYNYIYLVWIQDRGWGINDPLSDIYLSVSSDGGATFSSPLKVNDSNTVFGNMPTHAVASNGDLYIAWMDYNVVTGGTGVMILDKSTDGGASVGNDMPIDTIQLPPIQLNGGMEARSKGAAVVRCDPADASGLYLVYAADQDTTDADEADILFRSSADGGQTWADAIQVNDDSTDSDQMLPWMEVAPNGTIDIAWYDRRNDPNDLWWDVYTTHKSIVGNFSANALINLAAYPTPQTQSGLWLGEYLALHASDSMAYVAYTSSELDFNGDVFFTSFANPQVNPSIEEQAENAFEVMIYPNPTDDRVAVELKGIIPDQITLLDQLGRVIFAQNAQGERSILDLSALSPGVYFIQVKIGERTVTNRIIRN